MSLHVPTILLALLMAVGLFTVALATAEPSLREHDALGRWARGTWCLAGGFVLLAARAVLPGTLAILAGNALVSAALWQFGDALHRFVRGRPASRWHAALMGLVLAVLAVAALRWPLPLRTAVLSLLYAAQLAPTVAIVVREGWHQERSLRTVAVSLGVTTLALALRGVHAALHPEEYTAFFAASLGNGLTYLAAFLFPLGAGFGLLLAHLERTASQLRVLATHDALTGCANRGLFDALLRHGVDRALRERAALSLLLIDLDHFKQVNDRHGHPAGDRVLREVADALRGRLRASDVLARTGGEEFAVILPGSDGTGARRAAEVLRTTVEALALRTPGGLPLAVTASLGIVTMHGAEAALTPDELYALADEVLYRAKTGGRNRWLHRDDLPAEDTPRAATTPAPAPPAPPPAPPPPSPSAAASLP